MSNAPTVPSLPTLLLAETAVLAPGTLVDAMCGGHVVKAKIVEYIGEGNPLVTGHNYRMEFLSHHDSGATALCLDFGSNYWIKAGEKFAAGSVQIERAAYWIEQSANWNRK